MNDFFFFFFFPSSQNGLLSTPLSIDADNLLYSATSGDVPSACQVNSTTGKVNWCTKLLPSTAGGVTVAQAAVVEWAKVSVWLSNIGVLYALRQSDGAVVWNITLGNSTTVKAAVPAAPLSLDPFKVS